MYILKQQLVCSTRSRLLLNSNLGRQLMARTIDAVAVRYRYLSIKQYLKDCVSVKIFRCNCFIFGNVSDLILRANNQTRIFRSCLQQHMSAPSSEGQGWTMSEAGLNIKQNAMSITPDNIPQNKSWRCSKNFYNSTQCSCEKAGIRSTDALNASIPYRG